VLQEIQEDFENASTRPLLNNVIHKLQKLIADDLKLRSDQSKMIFQNKYPVRSQGFSERGTRTAKEFYRDECVEFSFEKLTDLDEMYAKTALALYNAMSQGLPKGVSQNYLATEIFQQCENFKWALKRVPPNFDTPLPKRPSDVTRIDLPRQQDMGNIHVLLTRLKGV
jgi:hypothetical protein